MTRLMTLGVAITAAGLIALPALAQQTTTNTMKDTSSTGKPTTVVTGGTAGTPSRHPAGNQAMGNSLGSSGSGSQSATGTAGASPGQAGKGASGAAASGTNH